MKLEVSISIQIFCKIWEALYIVCLFIYVGGKYKKLIRISCLENGGKIMKKIYIFYKIQQNIF